MKVLETMDVEKWSHQLTCHGCKSKLEIDVADLRKVSDYRDGDYAVCVCPVCNASLTLAMDLIPRAVWVQLRE